MYYLIVKISWGFVIVSNNSQRWAAMLSATQNLVSENRFKLDIIKRDQFDTIAGYTILIQMSNVQNQNINFETKYLNGFGLAGICVEPINDNTVLQP